jgi:hypothetical protein
LQFYAEIDGFLRINCFALQYLCCKSGVFDEETVEFSEAQLQLLDVQAIMQDV